MSWVSAGLGWIGDHLGGGGNPTPTPTKFTSPMNTGPQTTPGALPTAGSSSSPFTSAQQAQLQQAFSAAGIWDTIQGIGGDVWGAISKILPKNADGSIDWGGALKDVGSWIKDNKQTILDGLAAYNAYQRQGKSDAYAKQALDLAKESYAAKEPLRTAGMAGMLNPKGNAPDLSALSVAGQSGANLRAPSPTLGRSTQNLANAGTIAAGNPFTKGLPVAQIPTSSNTPAVPSAPPALPPIAPSSFGTNAPPPATPTPLPIAGQPGVTTRLEPPSSDISKYRPTRQPGDMIGPLPVATY